jgi:hypothetical protein
MIPTIGIMVGAYIFTRMISLLTRAGDRREKTVVRVFAVLTMALTTLCTADLFLSGFSSTLGAIKANLTATSTDSYPLSSSEQEEPVRDPGACRFKGDYGKTVCAQMTKRSCDRVEGSWARGQPCP